MSLKVVCARLFHYRLHCLWTMGWGRGVYSPLFNNRRDIDLNKVGEEWEKLKIIDKKGYSMCYNLLLLLVPPAGIGPAAHGLGIRTFEFSNLLIFYNLLKGQQL